MDLGKRLTSSDSQEKETKFALDESKEKDSEIETLNYFVNLVDERDEPQPGPSSAKTQFTPSSIEAEVEILDAAGLRKRSTVDVATSRVPSSSSETTIDGNDDLKEPTPEVVPLNRTVASMQISQRPVETESNALLWGGLCILVTELVTQGITGVICLFGLVLYFQFSMFPDKLWEFLGLLIVAVFSLMFQFGLWCGNSLEEMRTHFLQCHILPNWPLWCVAIFIILRAAYYIIFCFFLGSPWFMTMAGILIVMVNIPAFCIICCERFISRMIRMVHGLDNDSDVQQIENQ